MSRWDSQLIATELVPILEERHRYRCPGEAEALKARVLGRTVERRTKATGAARARGLFPTPYTSRATARKGTLQIPCSASNNSGSTEVNWLAGDRAARMAMEK